MAPEPADTPSSRLPGPPALRAGSPRANFVPGQVKARHQRLRRVTTWVTIAGLVAFLGFAVWGILALLSRPSAAETELENCRITLRGLTTDIQAFKADRGRLPVTLAELRAPDLPSRFEAQPRDRWDHPIEYRIVEEAAGEIRLRSLGPDGKPDTADDLVWPPGKSWK